MQLTAKPREVQIKKPAEAGRWNLLVGIYARQSVDKKDSISIETQINLCKKELAENEDFTVFQDKGFSGKNIDRPAFTRLLQAVESGEIKKIIVYRLDRISRSITDFANIIDMLEERKVGFASTSEKFDTSTPVGRAMLYIIMVFAQLERETIAERIRDNYYSRGKTGVWLGGPAPFGFTNARVLSGNKKVPTIQPNEDLEIVREIYALYLSPGASLGSVAKLLQGKYGSMWSNVRLARILHNPAYVKADADIYNFYAMKRCIIVNDVDEFTEQKGCSLYGKRDRSANKYRLTSDHVLSLALHDGVIDSGAWLKCQHKLSENKQIKNLGKGKHSWLTGLVKCGYCGYSMNVKVTESSKYFNCTGRYVSDSCLPDRLSTHRVTDIEQGVLTELRAYIKQLEGKQVHGEASEGGALNLLKQQLYKIDAQIERLMDSLADANDVAMKYINPRIVALDEQRQTLLQEINKKATKIGGLELPDMEGWEGLDLRVKREIVGSFVEKVNVFNDKIEVARRF